MKNKKTSNIFTNLLVLLFLSGPLRVGKAKDEVVKPIHSGFTLIEIIVSVTIFSLVLVSVMMIFTTSSSLSFKIDINRSMQENVKNIVEDIAESVRKNGINICPMSGGSDCHNMSVSTGKYSISDTLYSGTNKYYLGKKVSTDTYVKVFHQSECEGVNNFCTFLKNGQHPLSNQNVVLRNLEFYVSNDAIPKVTVRFAIEPAPKRGVPSKDLENSTLYFQTTITQRIIKDK